MNNFDFDAQTPVSRDRIYVSWSETWPLPEYIEAYLKARRLRTDDAARAHVFHVITRYPWTGPLRKVDVDYFLDTTINREELALPPAMQERKLK
jgi:hypothetical protein